MDLESSVSNRFHSNDMPFFYLCGIEKEAKFKILIFKAM